MRWKWVLLLGLAITGIGIYSAGLHVYFWSIARPVRPSAHEKAHEDVYWPVAQPRGTVLLVHGMNFDASGLHPLGEELKAMGYNVFIPRLAAHRGDPGETHHDPTELWHQQFAGWRRSLRGPVICAGYSLGGLLVTAEHEAGRLKCDRFLLFAPALATRTSLKVAKWVERVWPPQWYMPSGIPDGYKHFAVLGLAPSFALVHILDNLLSKMKMHQIHASSTPGLLFIDPKDQVVDAAGVLSLAKSQFPNWQIQPVHAVDLPENHAYHLIVDEAHLGHEQWTQVIATIQKFLSDF